MKPPIIEINALQTLCILCNLKLTSNTLFCPCEKLRRRRKACLCNIGYLGTYVYRKDMGTLINDALKLGPEQHIAAGAPPAVASNGARHCAATHLG